MEILNKTAFCGTDFTFYSNLSQIGDKHQVILVGKWTNDLKAGDFDPTRHVHLTFHVDISGSMNESMETSVARYSTSVSRIDIVKQALLEAIGMFSQAVNDGLSLGLSIVTFNTASTVVFHEFKLTMEHFPTLESKIRGICAGGGTSISSTILKGKEIDSSVIHDFEEGGYTKCESIRILLSDGYHNQGYKREDVMTEFKSYFDVCIGIGTPDNYDIELMNAIHKDNETSGADKMEDALDLMVDSLFGPVSRVAQDIEITVEGLKTVDSETKMMTNFMEFCHGTNKFVLPDIAYHQPIIIMGELDGTEISLGMKYRQDVKTKSETHSFTYIEHETNENETNLHKSIETLLMVPKLLDVYSKNVNDSSNHSAVIAKKDDMKTATDYLIDLGKKEVDTKNFYYTGLMAQGILDSINRISSFNTGDTFATPMMSQYLTTTVQQTKKSKMASVARTASSGYSASSPYRVDVEHRLPVIGRQNAVSMASCPPPVALDYGISALPTIPSSDNLATPRRHTTEPTKSVHFTN